MTTSDSGPRGKRSHRLSRVAGILEAPSIVTSVLMALLAASVFISGDSLWIDEGNAAYKATRPTLAEWWRALVGDGGSDAQMPGYMFFIWVWQKFAGSGEFALRLSNAVWLVTAAIALRHRKFAVLALLSSSFALYYANELRPYLMQIAATAIALRGFASGRPETAWSWLLGGCALLCLSSLTGVIWAAGLGLFFVADTPGVLRTGWFWKRLLLASPLFLGLGVHYLQSLLAGQGAADLGGGVFLSLSAAGYELIGLMGLGPGRSELRVDPRALLSHAFVLVPAALLMGCVPLLGLLRLSRGFGRRRWLALGLTLGVPFAVFVALILIKDFRVLGRHLAPLSVLLTLGLAFFLETSRSSGGTRGSLSRAAGVAVILLGLASALSLRFAERHRKDDYRGAAEIARETIREDRKLFWLACHRTGTYYGVEARDGVCELWNPKKDPLPELTGSERIIMTKPDVVDPRGEFRGLLERQGFTVTRELQSFSVWERNP